MIEGTASPQLAAYAAPPLDDWDRWNYTRTDRLLDAVSARYVSSGTYGLSDLDPYGTWRVVPTYGTVWVPTGVPAGWTPYSAGSWIARPRRTAGPGWTRRRGAGPRTTTGAGASWTGTGPGRPAP